MKKITPNVSFGKFAILFNILILCVFIVSMICLLNFDKVNMKLVQQTPLYENAQEELRKVEQPRRLAQAEVDFYVNKLNDLKNKEIPDDKKKLKEYNEEIERTQQTLDTKTDELKKVDDHIATQLILFEAIKNPFDDLGKQVHSSKTIFSIVLWITILFFAIKVLLFAAWKYNSLQNLRIIAPWMKKSTHPIWAYLGWLIPGYNFIKPYTVFNEVINETNYVLAEKNLTQNDSDTHTDFNIGLWWGLLLVTVLLFSFIISSTFFKQGPMYFKLSHTGVVIVAILMWALYLLQECLVIRKGIKMNQILFQNRSKFDLP